MMMTMTICSDDKKYGGTRALMYNNHSNNEDDNDDNDSNDNNDDNVCAHNCDLQVEW